MLSLVRFEVAVVPIAHLGQIARCLHNPVSAYANLGIAIEDVSSLIQAFKFKKDIHILRVSNQQLFIPRFCSPECRSVATLY